jgi:hypothetical protein
MAMARPVRTTALEMKSRFTDQALFIQQINFHRLQQNIFTCRTKSFYIMSSRCTVAGCSYVGDTTHSLNTHHGMVHSARSTVATGNPKRRRATSEPPRVSASELPRVDRMLRRSGRCRALTSSDAQGTLQPFDANEFDDLSVGESEEHALYSCGDEDSDSPDLRRRGSGSESPVADSDDSDDAAEDHMSPPQQVAAAINGPVSTMSAIITPS